MLLLAFYLYLSAGLLHSSPALLRLHNNPAHTPLTQHSARPPQNCTIGTSDCGCSITNPNCTCSNYKSNDISACISDQRFKIKVVQSAYAFQQTNAAGNSQSPISQKLLVMILDYSSCGYPASLNVATVRRLYLGPNEDGNAGLAMRYKQCSYGSFLLNTTAFMAAVVKPACSISVTNACSWWSLAQNADAAAKSQLNLTVFSSFTHFTYVMPPGLQGVCSWAGIALLPGRRTWMQSSNYGVMRWATAMQEGLHNYGG